MKDHKTVAFLIIQRDTIKYERYLKGYDAAHVHPLFSMAKSVVSMLIGTAIQDGLIRDVQQPITRLHPRAEEERLRQGHHRACAADDQRHRLH